ncbi:hypothetical protein V1264_018349 [Littorina saxatilis]|uniref:Uncharacterized protein n=2 Tax=Littorina saxatilis TaxID=31220 RepID=A0AAN9BDD7_9CAEN
MRSKLKTGFHWLLLVSCAACLLWWMFFTKSELQLAIGHVFAQVKNTVARTEFVAPVSLGATHMGLLETLRYKLSEFPEEKGFFPSSMCSSLKQPVGRCLENTCPSNISARPEDRLTEILRTWNGSIGHYLAAVDRSVASVTHHKYIFATASSSHYSNKLRTLVANLKQRLFPKVDNFTFVVFDLGLTTDQRKEIQKTCGCQMIDFPFSALPSFVKELKCYAWKPLIVNALLAKSEFTVWMDTSVLWSADADVTSIFQRLKERGMLFARDGLGTIAQRTQESTFQHFGDRSCQYEPYDEVYATYGFFRNEPFVREAVVKPWVSCALKWTCLCIPDHLSKLHCGHKLPRARSACHRFDQSALGIIVSKLYQNKRGLVDFPGGIFVERG